MSAQVTFAAANVLALAFNCLSHVPLLQVQVLTFFLWSMSRFLARPRVPVAFSPHFVPGLPHILLLIEWRQALSSYQDCLMLCSSS